MSADSTSLVVKVTLFRLNRDRQGERERLLISLVCVGVCGCVCAVPAGSDSAVCCVTLRSCFRTHRRVCVMIQASAVHTVYYHNTLCHTVLSLICYIHLLPSLFVPRVFLLNETLRHNVHVYTSEQLVLIFTISAASTYE